MGLFLARTLPEGFRFMRGSTARVPSHAGLTKAVLLED